SFWGSTSSTSANRKNIIERSKEDKQTRVPPVSEASCFFNCKGTCKKAFTARYCSTENPRKCPECRGNLQQKLFVPKCFDNAPPSAPY
ncbi:unnamed protein product, partial [Amoebophrya sp. A25]